MPVESRFARYPFLEAARDAVSELGVSLPALVAEDAPAVERGRERVEHALVAGTVAADDPGQWRRRDELLSYPVARILVSLLDDRAAVEKYADAEAATAVERFREDFDGDDDGLRSTDSARLALDDALREFGLADDVRAESPGRRGRHPGWFRVAVGPYLSLSDPGWGPRWRLVNRELADGEVRIEYDDVVSLLEEAVRRRVAEGLPFDVSDSPGSETLVSALEPAVADLRELLGDRTAASAADVDAVVPGLFPPCMRALLTRVRDGESLDPAAQFALVAFLVGLGMDAAEVVALTDGGVDAETAETQVGYLSDGSSTQYAPPSCASMDAYGICVNRDERCETITHPMAYYESALDDADADALTDWRETREAETAE